jgi:hypothetical protein
VEQRAAVVAGEEFAKRRRQGEPTSLRGGFDGGGSRRLAELVDALFVSREAGAPVGGFHGPALPQLAIAIGARYASIR